MISRNIMVKKVTIDTNTLCAPIEHRVGCNVDVVRLLKNINNGSKETKIVGTMVIHK